LFQQTLFTSQETQISSVDISALNQRTDLQTKLTFLATL